MRSLTLLWILAFTPQAVAQFVQQGGKLVGSGTVSATYLGLSAGITADGNTAILGGVYDSSGAGGAWIFTRGYTSQGAAWTQQGGKLAASGGTSTQGNAVAISGDGSTAIIGDYINGGGYTGAAWVFTRSGSGPWSAATGLVGAGSIGGSEQGSSVALSANGQIAVVGGPGDNTFTGAVWVFTRSSAGVWNQGIKLTASDATSLARFGSTVAVSSNGATVAVGGWGDNSDAGAVWVFSLAGSTWTQQGSKLVPNDSSGSAYAGISIAISGDGNTVMAGGSGDDNDAGAVWFFTRNATTGHWSQQGPKLVATDTAPVPQFLGTSVALSSDGNTAILGDPGGTPTVLGGGDVAIGALWVFARNASTGAWSQQGARLVGTGATNTSVLQGTSVALSADGKTVVTGAPADNSRTGAGWVFAQPAAARFAVSAPASEPSGTAFNFTVTALDANNNTFPSYSGTVHFTSSDPSAKLPADSALVNGTGAFSATLTTAGSQTITATDTVTSTLTGTSGAITVTSPIHVTVSAPATATVGAQFNFTVSAPGYSGTLHFTSTDAAAVLPANSALANGSGTFSATLNTPGDQTITVTDTVTAGITGISGSIVVSPVEVTPPSAVSVNIAAPSFTFVFTDPRGYQDLNVVDILINNFLDGRHACYLAYVVAQHALVLVDEPGDAGGPYALSANSQCGATLVSANGSGNTLTLGMTITFTARFAGDKIFYLAAGDVAGINSGWQPLGVVRVPGSAQTTTTAVVSMSPNRGTGLGPNPFTFSWSDTVGFADLGVEDILINSSLNGQQACYIAYSRPFNTLYLVNDNGDALLAGQSLAAAGSTGNSQCTVSWGANPVNASGNNLSLTLNVTFTAAFGGNRIIYVAARDVNEANSTDWHAMGTWTPQ